MLPCMEGTKVSTGSFAVRAWIHCYAEISRGLDETTRPLKGLSSIRHSLFHEILDCGAS